MFIQPRGQSWLWVRRVAATAALMFLTAPSLAADITPSQNNILARMNFAADPLTEAFGARAVMPLDVKHAARWSDVLRRQEASVSQPSPCANPDAGQCFQTFWTETVAELKTLPRAEQVRLVNDLVNRMGYWSDWDVYREADHWATPEEMFDKQGGDCEDFALFKYFLLRAAGVPAEELRVTLVALDDQAHMLSLAMVDGAPVVLDCVVLRATPPDQLRQYQAVFSLSEAGGWLLAAADKPAGAQSVLAR
jgi:predicted transglutaminase-like cysteine proteinase